MINHKILLEKIKNY